MKIKTSKQTKISKIENNQIKLNKMKQKTHKKTHGHLLNFPMFDGKNK